MDINKIELGFAVAAGLFGMIVLFATQSVYNMYVVIIITFFIILSRGKSEYHRK